MSIRLKKTKVENYPSQERDLNTTAITNTDKTAFNRYMNDKELRMKQKYELDELKSEIETLKQLILQQNK